MYSPVHYSPFSLHKTDHILSWLNTIFMHNSMPLFQCTNNILTTILRCILFIFQHPWNVNPLYNVQQVLYHGLSVFPLNQCTLSVFLISNLFTVYKIWQNCFIWGFLNCIIFKLFHLRHGLLYLSLALNLLYSWRWLWTSDPPSKTPQVLGILMLCGTRDQTHSFVHARQKLYQLSCILSALVLHIVKYIYIYIMILLGILNFIASLNMVLWGRLLQDSVCWTWQAFAICALMAVIAYLKPAHDQAG